MKSIERWRDQVVDNLLLALCVLGGLGLPPMFIQANWVFGPMGLSTLIAWLALLVGVVLRRRMPFSVRTSILIGVLFFAMAMGVIQVGPLFGPGLAGALAVLVAGLVFGRSASIGVLLLGMVVILVVGLMQSNAILPTPSIHTMQSTVGNSVREAIAFGLFTGVMTVMTNRVVGRIEASFGEVAAALEKTRVEEAEKTAAQVALGEAERAVSELQRLEAVGRLAGGVAHDFNNVLLVMMAGTDLLVHEGLTKEQLEVIDDMNGAIEHASQLTAQLLAFGRRDVSVPKDLDPQVLFESTARILQRLLPEDIELVLQIDDPPALTADPVQMQQIILNLAINARDAMPDGGRLTLYAAATNEDEPRLVIEVRDEGHGIAEGIRDKVFDPFFTTKPADQGTGLGLATVFGLVSGLGGSITLDTVEGDGTTFRVLLPSAGDVPSAMKLLDVHETTIDVLCTDGVMPGGRCKDLIDAYRHRFPDGPILVCSGYVREELVKRDIASGLAEYLPKPFTGTVLVDRISAMVER